MLHVGIFYSGLLNTYTPKGRWSLGIKEWSHGYFILQMTDDEAIAETELEYEQIPAGGRIQRCAKRTAQTAAILRR